MTIWVVVADAARARALAADKPNGALTEIEDRVHYASRLHGRDLETSAPSRTHDSNGPGRHAIEPSTDVREQQVEAFAREVSRWLDEARNANRFQKLYLVAAPHFLGLLRGMLSSGVKALVAGEIDKVLTQHTPAEVRTHLPEYL